jgi:Ca2+-binding RTX toxin-like protein
VQCLIAYSEFVYRQLAIREKRQQEEEETVRQRLQIQERFTGLSPLRFLSVASLFTGLILMIAATISAPIVVVVYAANIQGTPGDDTLNGTPKADTINGFEGNDKLFGKTGNDILDGDKGEDAIYGGNGNDKIKDGSDHPPEEGGEFNKVYGGSGNDNIDVGITFTGLDYYNVYGENGADYIEVVSSATIWGGNNGDTIYCTGYECQVYGEKGNDEIHVELYDVGSGVFGGSGNDKIFGRGYGVSGDEGNDHLSLDSAVDLKGGEGDDVLEVLEPSSETYYNGGPGADTFNCSSGPGDIVEDYNPEEGDQIISPADCETVEGTSTD